MVLKTNHDDDDLKSPDSVSMHTQRFVTLMYCRHSVFGAPLSATASIWRLAQNVTARCPAVSMCHYWFKTALKFYYVFACF